MLTISAAATDCERSFSECGDLLGTQRLEMKLDLLAALQSLKSWKKIGIQLQTSSNFGPVQGLTIEQIFKIQQQYHRFDCS
jgi:hypothetical protein